jgi:hypothetical protein
LEYEEKLDSQLILEHNALREIQSALTQMSFSPTTSKVKKNNPRAVNVDQLD